MAMRAGVTGAHRTKSLVILMMITIIMKMMCINIFAVIIIVVGFF